MKRVGGKTKRPRADTAPEAAHVRPRRDRYFWALLGILVIGAALRLYAVETANFWLDEFWTLELSCGNDTAHEHLPIDRLIFPAPSPTSLATAKPWWSIWTSLDQVTHPPLFFLLLRGWREVLGPGDMAARLLPCVASVAAIGLLYAAVRRLRGVRAGVWAALIMAVAGQQVFYAQEVRSYSLIVAMGLAAAVVLIDIEQRGAGLGRLTMFGTLVFSLLMTHYFTAGLVAALLVYALARFPRPVAIRVGVATVSAGILFLVVWGPFMLRQRQAMSLQGEGAAAFLLESGSGHVWQTLLRALAVPAQAIAPASFMDPAHLPPPVAWVMVPVFFAPLVFVRRRPDLLFWYLWFAGVVIPLLLLDLTRSSMHLAYPRYTLLAGPAVFAIAGAGLDALKPSLRFIPPALALTACGLLLRDSLQQPQSKEEWESVATAASQMMGVGDPLVVTASPDQAAIVYLYVSHDLGPVDRPVVILAHPASASLVEQLRRARHAWVINGWLGPMPGLIGGAWFEPRAGPRFGEMVWPPAAPKQASGL